MYAVIENGTIKESFFGEIPESLKDKALTILPDSADLSADYPDVKCYDAAWQLRPRAELVLDGLEPLSPYEKLDGKEIVLKTKEELVAEGLIPPPEGLAHYVGNDLVPYTPEEAFKAGRITEANYLATLATQARAKRDQLLAQYVDAINPFRYAAMAQVERDTITKYRTDLLNVPQQTGFPMKIAWPTPPENTVRRTTEATIWQ